MPDFLSQLQQALSAPTPALGTVPPRPTGVFVVTVDLVSEATIHVPIPDDVENIEQYLLEQWPDAPDALESGDAPTTLKVVSLTPDAVEGVDVGVCLNQADLDAWDAQYGDTHNADGTVYDVDADEDDDEEDDDSDDDDEEDFVYVADSVEDDEDDAEEFDDVIANLYEQLSDESGDEIPL